MKLSDPRGIVLSPEIAFLWGYIIVQLELNDLQIEAVNGEDCHVIDLGGILSGLLVADKDYLLAIKH